MANGNLESLQGKINGGQPWQSVCNDVGRALCGTTWPGLSQALIWHVIEKSWPRHKKDGKRPDAVPATISLTERAERWSTTKQRVYEARRYLVERHVLVEADGGYLFNKRADQWGTGTPGSKGFKPLLKPSMLADAVAAMSNLSEARPSRKSVTPVTESRYSEAETVTESRYAGNEDPLPESPNPVTSVTESRYSPYIGTRASEDSQTSKDLLKTEADDRKAASLAEEKARQDERDDLLEAAKWLATSQECSDKPERIAAIVDRWLTKYPAAMIDDAFGQAMVKSGTGGVWQYVAACLVTLQDEADRRAREKALEPQYVPPTEESRARQAAKFQIRNGRKIQLYTGIDLGPWDPEQERKKLALMWGAEVAAKLRLPA